ncbi:VOC family protein [Paenibacillus sp. HJGM_3]|uniref:VOC family protein n=1 Tax=Paenibacillus sp. HJGM_3 TaxID=3379816 RepID=UPI00386EC6E5
MATIVKKFVVGIPVTKSGNAEEYEKAIEWYVNVLGFEVVWKMGIACLKLENGQEIGLFGEEDDENSLWYTGDIKSNPHYSIQFITDNIEELRSDLIKSGVAVGEIILDTGGGEPIMMFYDPYGNRFWAVEDKKIDRVKQARDQAIAQLSVDTLS